MPYRESNNESDMSKPHDVIFVDPMSHEMQKHFNVIEVEDEIKSLFGLIIFYFDVFLELEGKVGEIDEILHADILITMIQEENAKESYNYCQTENEIIYSNKNVWWVKVFKKRKYCLLFFFILFITIIILGISLPLCL